MSTADLIDLKQLQALAFYFQAEREYHSLSMSMPTPSLIEETPFQHDVSGLLAGINKSHLVCRNTPQQVPPPPKYHGPPREIKLKNYTEVPKANEMTLPLPSGWDDDEVYEWCVSLNGREGKRR